MATAYGKTLDELAEQYDMYPWVEVVQATLPDAPTTGQQANFSMQQNYGLVFDQTPFFGFGKDSGADFVDLSFNNGTFQWATGAGPNKLTQSQLLATTERILGKYSDEWVRLSSGVYIEQNELVSAIYSLLNTSATTNNQLNWGLRGYKLQAKGTIDPPQLTRKQHLDRGAKLVPYVYNIQVKVDMTQGISPSFGNLLFDKDFLCHKIRAGSFANFDPDGSLRYEELIGVNFLPTIRGPLMKGFVPIQMIEGTQLRTQWALERPMTIRKGEIWQISGMPLVPHAGIDTQTIEVIFDGERIFY